jgi:hypothetical protein
MEKPRHKKGTQDQSLNLVMKHHPIEAMPARMNKRPRQNIAINKSKTK